MGATGDEDSLVPDTSNREESLRSSEEAGGIGEDGAEYGKLSSLSNNQQGGSRKNIPGLAMEKEWEGVSVEGER